MRVEFAKELRALPRAWCVWPLPLVAAALAWRFIPLNAEFYEEYINFDPQAEDEVAASYYTDVVAVHTSGFSSAYLLAVLARAMLALRDRCVTGRLPVACTASGEGPDAGPDLDVGLLFLAKTAAGGLFSSSAVCSPSRCGQRWESVSAGSSAAGGAWRSWPLFRLLSWPSYIRWPRGFYDPVESVGAVIVAVLMLPLYAWGLLI